MLFVCTGNICRSAAAETILRHRIHSGGAAGELSVASAGVACANGWRMDATIAELLAKRGCTGMAEYRSRQLTGSIVASADLILTGTREHRARIGKDWPDAYEHTFTMRECAWLLAEMPLEVRLSLPAAIDARARAVLRWLQAERGLLATPLEEMDIADPIGRRPSAYRRMVSEVAAALDALADVLVPATTP